MKSVAKKPREREASIVCFQLAPYFKTRLDALIAEREERLKSVALEIERHRFEALAGAHGPRKIEPANLTDILGVLPWE